MSINIEVKHPPSTAVQRDAYSNFFLAWNGSGYDVYYPAEAYNHGVNPSGPHQSIGLDDGIELDIPSDWSGALYMSIGVSARYPAPATQNATPGMFRTWESEGTKDNYGQRWYVGISMPEVLSSGTVTYSLAEKGLPRPSGNSTQLKVSITIRRRKGQGH